MSETSLAHKFTILVTGAGGPAGTNTLKLLRGCCRLIATDASPYSEGFIFSDKNYIIPPATNAEGFLRALKKIIETDGVHLVIPTVDEEIEVLSNTDFSYKYVIVIHPKETVEICLNKLNLYRFLTSKEPGLVPKFSEDPKDLDSEIVVKKPIKGRGGRGIEIGPKTKFKPESGFFYVEYLSGPEWTVDAVTDKDGNELAIVPRIRRKTRGGVSVVGEVRLRDDILRLSRTVLKILRFTGPLNIQFKENDQGIPKLQEINVRFSGGLDITAAAGVNMPKILIENWILGIKPVNISVKEGVYAKVSTSYALPGEIYIA